MAVAASLVRHRVARSSPRAGPGSPEGSSEEARLTAALRSTALRHSLCPVDAVARAAQVALPTAVRHVTLERLRSVRGRGQCARGAMVHCRSAPLDEDPPGEGRKRARRTSDTLPPPCPGGAPESLSVRLDSLRESGAAAGAWQVTGPVRCVEQAWQHVAPLTCEGRLGSWASLEAGRFGARLAVGVDDVLDTGRVLRRALALRNALYDANAQSLGRGRCVLWSVDLGDAGRACAVWEHRAAQPHVLLPKLRGLPRVALPGAAGDGPFPWQPRPQAASPAAAVVQDPT